MHCLHVLQFMYHNRAKFKNSLVVNEVSETYSRKSSLMYSKSEVEALCSNGAKRTKVIQQS